MAKELKERIGESVGYFDSQSGKSLNIVKSVDITDECPARKGTDQMVRLDFSQATRGILFELTDCYSGKDIGTGVMNFLGDLGPGFTFRDSTAGFCSFAEKFGLTPQQFLDIVKSAAPPVDREKLVSDFRLYRANEDLDDPVAYHQFMGMLKSVGLTMEEIEAAET